MGSVLDRLFEEVSISLAEAITIVNNIGNMIFRHQCASRKSLYTSYNGEGIREQVPGKKKSARRVVMKNI